MNDFFAAADPEKQQRIINAAFKEFAMQGFKGASTNRIVKEAGIGKGMLFYYFNSKLELFQFLTDYAIETVKKYLSKLDDTEYEKDFIERCRTASRIKLQCYIENPHVFDFLTKIFWNREEFDINDGIKERFDEIEKLRKKYLEDFMANRDLSKFRSDIPVEKLIRYIKWQMDGYAQKIISEYDNSTLLSEQDYIKYFDEFDEFLDDLKIIYYKSDLSEQPMRGD